MKLRLVVLAAATALAVAVPATAGPPVKDTSTVWSFADLSALGTSTLLRQAGGVQMTLGTGSLPAGKVVTVWWIIFNHPEFCQFGEAPAPATGFPGTTCGAGDLGIVEGLVADPRVDPAVVHATGKVIGHDGIGNFAAYLSAGATKEEILLSDGTPLAEPFGADVHLVVHPHGTNDYPSIGQEIQHFGCGSCPDHSFTAHEVGST